MIYLLLIPILLFCLTVLVGYLLCRRVIYPRIRSVAETRRLEIEAHNMDPQEFEAWPREELSLR